MTKDNDTPIRSIFVTLKMIIDRDTPVSVETLRKSTGFGQRRVQRHVELLTDIGMIERTGKYDCNGYRYASVLPLTICQKNTRQHSEGETPI